MENDWLVKYHCCNKNLFIVMTCFLNKNNYLSPVITSFRSRGCDWSSTPFVRNMIMNHGIWCLFSDKLCDVLEGLTRVQFGGIVQDYPNLVACWVVKWMMFWTMFCCAGPTADPWFTRNMFYRLQKRFQKGLLQTMWAVPLLIVLRKCTAKMMIIIQYGNPFNQPTKDHGTGFWIAWLTQTWM